MRRIMLTATLAVVFFVVQAPQTRAADDEPALGPVIASIADDSVDPMEPANIDVGSPSPAPEKNITLNPTRCTPKRYFLDPFVRSGCPESVARLAIPSVMSNQYSGGYVGGGLAIFGQGRCPDDGVFGVDYDGILRKRIWLNWSHGRRYQGGTKGYKTDGPKLHHERD